MNAASRGVGGLALDEVRVSDVLIVGTGIAGLAAALGCAGRAVTVLTKTRLGEGGSSSWAQGGVAVAVGADDSPALHAADTLAVAGGLAEPAKVELLTAEGPVRVAELVRLGAAFDAPAGCRPDGGRRSATEARFALGREAAHSRRRILHAGGDATGRELVRALTAAVRRAPGLRVEEECFAVDLVIDPTGRHPSAKRRVAGVLALDREGRRVLHLAGATVLATGGAGQLYRHTTNPPEVTADGLAMAARAGARLADLEFVQFHPTALAVAGDGVRLPLLTEALRGEGAILVDGAGRRFMADEHPLAELAPRDVVARAIHRRLAAGDEVFLDARGAIGDRFPQRFPTVWRAAMDAGLDPRRALLPVVPAAHYHMGGVLTDDRGRTTLAGLWACGETAATGVHGANRLASNSLLEGLVFGARVAGDLARRLTAVPGAAPEALRRLEVAGERLAVAVDRREEGGRADRVASAGRSPGERGRTLRRRLQALMGNEVGLERDRAGLERAVGALRGMDAEIDALTAAAVAVGDAGPGGSLRELLETRNLLTAGSLVATAAHARRESRGAHHRLDHPAEDPALRRRLLVSLRPGAAPLLTYSPPVGGVAPDATAAHLLPGTVSPATAEGGSRAKDAAAAGAAR